MGIALLAHAIGAEARVRALQEAATSALSRDVVLRVPIVTAGKPGHSYVRRARDFIGDRRDDRRPSARGRLAEQAGGRIPGAVVTVEKPTPVRSKRQHDPHRLPHRTGEVRNRGVHRDHEIERVEDRHSIAEVGDLRTEIDQWRSSPIGSDLRLAGAFLQRYEGGAGNFGERRQSRQGD